MSTDPWWQHAIIYRVHGQSEKGGDPPPTTADLSFLESRITAIRAVGIDALLVPAPPVPGQGAPADAPASAPTQVDQLDELVRVASSRGVRVLLTLTPGSASEDPSGVTRYWLSRGIAGFYVITPKGASQSDALAFVQSIRRLTTASVGQRIVISDLGLATPQSLGATQPLAPVARHPSGGRSSRVTGVAAQLELDSRLSNADFNAASLRAALAQTAGQPNMLTDFPRVDDSSGQSGRDSVARVKAVLSLLTHPAAIIDASARLVFDAMPEHVEPAEDDTQTTKSPAASAPGVYLPYKPYVPPSKNRGEPPQPAPKDPVTAWYKQLATLHHGNLALRSGTSTFLDFDRQNALVWVARPVLTSGRAVPVVVVCNLSGSTIQLSLRTDLERLGLRAKSLRTLLRSDESPEPQDFAAIVLPPYGTLIADLRR